MFPSFSFSKKGKGSATREGGCGGSNSRKGAGNACVAISSCCRHFNCLNYAIILTVFSLGVRRGGIAVPRLLRIKDCFALKTVVADWC